MNSTPGSDDSLGANLSAVMSDADESEALHEPEEDTQPPETFSEAVKLHNAGKFRLAVGKDGHIRCLLVKEEYAKRFVNGTGKEWEIKNVHCRASQWHRLQRTWRQEHYSIRIDVRPLLASCQYFETSLFETASVAVDREIDHLAFARCLLGRLDQRHD